MVFILGINPSHDCSAALLRDGEIIACAEEERFSRIKNHIGFPTNAVNFVLRFAGIQPMDTSTIILE